jgi:Tfp pilus assembly protein PilN
MKAVNLIPVDAPGGRTDGGRAGSAVYVLLGVLATLLVGVTAYVLTGNDVVKHRQELAALQSEATAVQLQAERLHSYVEFATLAQARVQTVRQLGATRFDWHRAFTDLSKVLPDNVWLTSLLGTVAPGVSVEGAASGQTNGLRSSLPNPAIEMTGCTTGHEGVVRLVSRLRLLDGVERVSLADSVKADDAAGGGGNGDDCRHGHTSFPQFDLVVFFAPLPTATAPIDPAAGATATTPSAAAPASPTGSAVQ